MPANIHSSLATLAAGALGAPAASSADVGSLIRVLAARATDQDRNVGLVARRALWNTIRRAGRPGAEEEKAVAVTTLIALLSTDLATELQREVLWMLSEIGGNQSAEPIAALLTHASLREDARMALERIPTTKATALLQAALADAPADFKIHLAQSLRSRGVTVRGLPCQKLVPTKKTTIQPTE